MSHQDIYANESLIAISRENVLSRSNSITLQQDERIFLRFRLTHNATLNAIAVGVSITPSQHTQSRRLSASQLIEDRERQLFDIRLRKANKLKQSIPHIFPSSTHRLASRQVT